MHVFLVQLELVCHSTLIVTFIAGQDPVEMFLLHVFPKIRVKDSDSVEFGSQK